MIAEPVFPRSPGYEPSSLPSTKIRAQPSPLAEEGARGTRAGEGGDPARHFRRSRRQSRTPHLAGSSAIWISLLCILCAEANNLRVFSLVLFPTLPAIPQLLAADPSPEALINSGHWKRARRLVEQRYQSKPDDAQSAYLLAQVKEAFGELYAALPLAEKAVALDGNNSSYHYELAQVYGQMADRASFFKAGGLAKRFKAEAERAAELDPKNIDARFGLIEYYLRAPRLMGGSKVRAAAMAEEIGKSDAARGYLAQARLAQEEKNSTKQEEFLKKALATSPVNYEVLMALANFYASEDPRKLDLTERYAREGLKTDAGQAAAYSSLASAYALSEHWKDLDAILAKAEEKISDDFSPHYQAGLTLLREAKDLPRAERYFRKYLSQEPEGNAPTLAEAHWRLGLVLEKEGHKSEATSEIQTALSIRPDLREARKDLKRLAP